jgi:competence protein ComFC
LKKLKRGYNPAELLSHEIAKEHFLALISKLLLQPKRKAAQALNDKHQRTQIQAEAFRAKVSQNQKRLHMLLVDDVCTTGATIGACYWAL